MKVTPFKGLGSFGIYIDDVDFNNMSDDQWFEIGQLHMKNLVTIIRNCNVPYRDTLKWTDKWGPRRHSSMLTIGQRYPNLTHKQLVELAFKDSSELETAHKHAIKSYFHTRAANGIQRICDERKEDGSQKGMFPGGEIFWHSNEAGNVIFGPGVALLGAQNMQGTATGFLQTADYYQSVSDSFRSELDEMILVHKFSPGKLSKEIDPVQDDLMHLSMVPRDNEEIPMVIQSPGGITGLHYSINTVHGIKGMSKSESDKVFEQINKDLMQDKYVYDHWYVNSNDWLLFDNSITNHRRLGYSEGRLAYRIQHGYENIQIPNYNPYFQKDFAELYNSKLNELDEFMEKLVA